METTSNKFTSFEVFSFTVCSTIGIGLGFLPYAGGVEIRSDWLQLIFASVPYFFLLYLIGSYYKKHPNQHFFKHLKARMPTFLFWIIALYIIASILYAGIVSLHSLNQTVEVFMLPSTRRWIVSLVFLLPTALALYYGIRTITRFIVILITLEFLTFAIIFSLGFSDYFRWIYIPPIHAVNPSTYLQASIADLARYGGLVSLLGFLPYVRMGVARTRSIHFGLLFVVAQYVILSIVVLGTFGYEESLTLISPLISITQLFLAGNAIFERLDLLFLMIWILVMFKMFVIQLWFIGYLANILLPKVKKMTIYFFYIFILFFGMISTSGHTYSGWGLHNYNAFIYSCLIPSIFLLYLLKRRST